MKYKKILKKLGNNFSQNMINLSYGFSTNTVNLKKRQLFIYLKTTRNNL